ncbi:MAG: hypothetical protein AW07_01469 [Candidatus Accumulibacter sp. SK-11]|nr:MAG: hypothetical protein AW07_01469 [Candidatus Accumulibacter sp. SK-11]
MEIPLRRAAAEPRQLPIEDVRLFAGDGRLGKHRELNAVSEATELCNLAIAARLLIAEVVGRKADDDEATLPEARVKFLETVVLRGEPAVTGGIHDQQDLAAPLTKRLRFLVEQGGEAVIEQRRAARRRGYPQRACQTADCDDNAKQRFHSCRGQCSLVFRNIAPKSVVVNTFFPTCPGQRIRSDSLIDFHRAPPTATEAPPTGQKKARRMAGFAAPRGCRQRRPTRIR